MQQQDKKDVPVTVIANRQKLSFLLLCSSLNCYQKALPTFRVGLPAPNDLSKEIPHRSA